MKLVKDVMVRDVITISPFASIREALSQMKQHSLKSLVVEKTSEHDAWGLITYTNVLKTVISVGENLNVRHAASLMSKYRIKRLLVLADNDLKGFVVMDDIMAALLDSID